MKNSDLNFAANLLGIGFADTSRSSRPEATDHGHGMYIVNPFVVSKKTAPWTNGYALRYKAKGEKTSKHLSYHSSHAGVQTAIKKHSESIAKAKPSFSTTTFSTNVETGFSGEAFKKLEKKLSHKKGIHNAAALTAWLGRKSLGKKAFQKRAEEGKEAKA